ncbi:SET domain-containing protein [Laetiporus sulphureus 93-53]|uniref:SET domain-containing protein n=1 Tax=Laetiporus sulphureus 93-53 TaxID=1314785 RepID=A0A165E3V0_9APHY|nr:SET domain-containing protein [Laetiporus sulphureus 93-53]KZT06198.1 SET domain-containing protein [Laetiporus sulphureus 93-53]
MARREIWKPSRRPLEDWENDGTDREWEFSGIVGEEIDTFGVKRYEIKWKDWQRADGTNTTWQRDMSDMSDVQREWDEMQEDKRLEAARRNTGVKVRLEPGQVWHEDATIEMARGYEEQYREALRRNLKLYARWDNTLKSVHSDSDDGGQRRDGGGAGDESSDSTGSPRLPKRKRLRPSSDRTSSMATQPQEPRNNPPRPVPPSRPKPTPRFVRDSPSSDDDDAMAVDLTARPTRPLPRRRRQVVRSDSSPSPPRTTFVRSRSSPSPRHMTLQEQWTRMAARAGAAAIYFVNEVNAEEVPPGLDGFRYCERHYIRAVGVPEPDEQYLLSCECELSCDAQVCGCQELSDIVDDFGDKVFAYTDQRQFKDNLSPGEEVIECNKNCSCDPRSCPNRVAQQPRDVPIEVFRTEECGWGVRATSDLPKGKVLGIYTGELITREEARRRTGQSKSYIFDLDVHEADDDSVEEEYAKYSVDSYRCGNWTRFINHSCEPNMRVYPVVWDTVPELNQPYLAFVTTQTIVARTELTIDYDPKATEEHRRSKGKGRRILPEGARPCICGADSCRGWITI